MSMKIFPGSGGVTSHAALTGLGIDDHLQYLYKDGRGGGQTIKGGTAAGEQLLIESTSHATKGGVQIDDDILLGTADPFGRIQVCNYFVNSILRMGWATGDGDASNVATQGAVFYGQNVNGDPMGDNDLGFARIKHDRFGLYSSDFGGFSGYLFRIDHTDFYLKNNTGTTTFSFDRSIGKLSIVDFNASGLQVFADNASAITGGLVVGDFYRNGADPDLVCVVH